jgi:UDP-N-acetylmuramoylalanine--D-glutamate ligase
MSSPDIAILGGGESGVGAAILAKKQGFDVFLSDKGAINEKYKNVLKNYGIKWEENRHSEKLILSAGEIIKSPGIPDTVEMVMKAGQLKIPVISEIEFAGRYTDAFKICITGSNGKTTTTLLTGHILKVPDTMWALPEMWVEVLPGRLQKRIMISMCWRYRAFSLMVCLNLKLMLQYF